MNLCSIRFHLQYVIVPLSLFVTTVLTNCELVDIVSNCQYTIVCHHHAGRASVPLCRGEQNITFVVTGANTPLVNLNYFGATNFDERLRYFKVTNSTWSVLFTNAFKYFLNVFHVDFAGNNIKEIKSDAFANLPRLRYLNLSSNCISVIENRGFKVSDAGNVLETLDLSNNSLTNLYEHIFYPLINLKYLYLQSNLIHFIDDSAFLYTKNVVILHLENNLISSLNMTLIHLKALTDLDLSHNVMTHLSGFEINRLNSLVNLNLSHNELSTLDYDCFSNEYNIKIIDLSHNKIRSTIENTMFTNNKRLVFLNLYNNYISTIQDNTFANSSLVYLNLEKNNITGEIGQNMFTGLQKIITKSLDLSRQNITAINKYSFSKMYSLFSVNVSHNRISLVEQKSFGNALNVLDLSYNNISSLDFLNDSLSNLTELYLKNNSISIVKKNAFQNQITLITLDLSDNKIIQIEQYSLPLKKIQYLLLSGNFIGGVIKNNTFSGAKYLRFLNLSNFNITTVDDMAFVDLPVLARLNLSHNQIDSFKPNNFQGMENLYSLDISSNCLNTLVLNGTKLTNLLAFFLNNNNLTNISEIFPGNSGRSVHYLDMSFNNISDLTGVNNEKFPNISVLRLAHNQLVAFNNEYTNSLTTLVDLDLSSNRLTNVLLTYFKALLNVNLSDNNLTSIDSAMFQNSEYLKAIDLSNNKISTVKPGTFQSMKNLKLLNLSSNYLTELRYGSLKGLHKTELLDLSRNMIRNLSVDVFHECLKLESLILDYNQIKTFNVQELLENYLLNLKTLSLGGNPISCREVNLNVYAGRNKRVEVTSLDKIYHEDNVHGILCGDYLLSTTVGTTVVTVQQTTESLSSTSSIVLIWCCILTTLLVLVVVFLFIKRKKVYSVNLNRFINPININESELEMNGSEYQSDN